MRIDPTQYRLHDGLLEAIAYNPADQTLVLSIELNLALAVSFDPNNLVDDFRQTRLIFHGVSAIEPALPQFADGRTDPDSIYGDIYEFSWHQSAPPSVTLNATITDDLNETEKFISCTIQYQTVEWQIDDPAPAEPAKPFQPTEINQQAWQQFEQTLDAQRQAGHDVTLDLQVINLPNADQRPIILAARYQVDGLPFYQAFHYHNDAVYDLSDATSEQLLAALRSTIEQRIPQPWISARVVAEIPAADHGLLYGRFSSANQLRHEQGFEVDYQLFFILRELRERSTPAWNTIELVTSPQQPLHLTMSFADGQVEQTSF
ncbi:hypothetical protein [Herpetosiphon giganteus]|uniref:hypothetical protein n=1 Tax=Herpetosiphon giganteus TaxID=2029754 RepID=UPI00195A8F32|nr:hypothetical protein [Herpetosiphon giganteus]MBM7844983.1 hypothetical protein [Herpetosiphon giganteus]